jgi:subtilisin family serine protease
LKTITALFISVNLGFSVFGQDYYYSNNERHYIERAENWVTVQVKPEDTVRFGNIVNEEPFLKIRKTLVPGRGIYWLEQMDRPVGKALERLKEEVCIVRVFPGFYNLNEAGDSMHYIMSDVFNVQFRDNVSDRAIRRISDRYHVEIISEGLENEYVLRLTEESPLNTLDISNLFYEEKLTVWSLPDFYVRMSPEFIYSPHFRDQWYLHNIGQGGGIAGLDINILPAWEITTGSTDIIVAVIDEGVDPHESFYEGQLIKGFNASDKSNNGLPQNSDSHGQAVAGIIAANHSAYGIRGVAPNVRIMSVRIEGASVSDQAAAIDTAWVRGADIINLSWGWSGHFDNIAQALQRAMSNGRNGKGTLVVKSAGNTYGGEVSFPGNLPGVLTVGAVTNLNRPARYTPASDRVDLVAPSGDRRNKNALNIITIDRHEPYGYVSDGRYYYNFDGTSAAAPQVSGVAALIFSLNPELTIEQVRNILKDTATSYGKTNWAGAGRLNAYQALYEVYRLTGPSIVRTSRDTFALGWIPENAHISWTFSPGYVIAPYSGTGTLATFNSGSEAGGILTFTIQQPGARPLIISRDIYVGPSLP